MGIMESIDIGANALRVHGKRIDIHAKNIANLDTPNYVRKIPVLNATDDFSFHGLLNNMKEDVFIPDAVIALSKNESCPSSTPEDTSTDSDGSTTLLSRSRYLNRSLLFISSTSSL